MAPRNICFWLIAVTCFCIANGAHPTPRPSRRPTSIPTICSGGYVDCNDAPNFDKIKCKLRRMCTSSYCTGSKTRLTPEFLKRSRQKMLLQKPCDTKCAGIMPEPQLVFNKESVQDCETNLGNGVKKAKVRVVKANGQTIEVADNGYYLLGKRTVVAPSMYDASDSQYVMLEETSSRFPSTDRDFSLVVIFSLDWENTREGVYVPVVTKEKSRQKRGNDWSVWVRVSKKFGSMEILFHSKMEFEITMSARTRIRRDIMSVCVTYSSGVDPKKGRSISLFASGRLLVSKDLQENPQIGQPVTGNIKIGRASDGWKLKVPSETAKRGCTDVSFEGVVYSLNMYDFTLTELEVFAIETCQMREEYFPITDPHDDQFLDGQSRCRALGYELAIVKTKMSNDHAYDACWEIDPIDCFIRVEGAFTNYVENMEVIDNRTMMNGTVVYEKDGIEYCAVLIIFGKNKRKWVQRPCKKNEGIICGPTYDKVCNGTLPPTPSPTQNPTMTPTRNPSNNPTKNPSRKPTENPSKNPTSKPTSKPTSEPTNKPTAKPSQNPTSKPSQNPTSRPSPRPSEQPTLRPTEKPIPHGVSVGTVRPTPSPIQSPTSKPSTKPTKSPSNKPSPSPTRKPSKNPTTKPSQNPTSKPTLNPTAKPTQKPTTSPTRNPTKNPTSNPTKKPTSIPSTSPTYFPTLSPTVPCKNRTVCIMANKSCVVNRNMKYKFMKLNNNGEIEKVTKSVRRLGVTQCCGEMKQSDIWLTSGNLVGDPNEIQFNEADGSLEFDGSVFGVLKNSASINQDATQGFTFSVEFSLNSDAPETNMALLSQSDGHDSARGWSLWVTFRGNGGVGQLDFLFQYGLQQMTAISAPMPSSYKTKRVQLGGSYECQSNTLQLYLTVDGIIRELSVNSGSNGVQSSCASSQRVDVLVGGASAAMNFQNCWGFLEGKIYAVDFWDGFSKKRQYKKCVSPSDVWAGEAATESHVRMSNTLIIGASAVAVVLIVSLACLCGKCASKRRLAKYEVIDANSHVPDVRNADTKKMARHKNVVVNETTPLKG